MNNNDLPSLTLQNLPWASDMDRDSYGLWAEFTICDVTQRMRWIGPGRFLMGSPPDEPGRYGEADVRWDGRWNEGPQHEVRLSKGYWLFDTPVTQALWTMVMNSNPSRFTDNTKHPVESVTWNDAEQFLQRINGLTDLHLVLPTEAQWEYACRAGTMTPNYAGGEKDLGDIAWFSANSGVQTHPVATKPCNPWGLHDMLGNVFEWCADDLRKYSTKAVTDPVGASDGTGRALRGGSWRNGTCDVRAALRVAEGSADRFDSVGFRCARLHP